MKRTVFNNNLFAECFIQIGERKPLAKIAKDTAAGAVTAEKSKDVLEELWNVAVEEMNFLTEAANLEEFARRNKEVAYVGAGKAS